MKGARAVLTRAGLEFSERALVGDPAPCIIKAAEGGRFDLVIMGSQGRNALKSLLLGSVTSKVLSRCKVPVMVVR
jgi:nucleotide-binding universal stress UspA family protein